MIDFFSDTKTKPTAAMRAAIAAAEVGDEQKGEDPTTRRLEERVAALLGQEAAVFLPSGTLANEIAIRVHCRPGDEVFCDRTAHIITAEGGGPAALSGVMVTGLEGTRGIFTAEQLVAAQRHVSRYTPQPRLVVVEQTSNLGGGAIWPLPAIQAVTAAARERGMACHMDGARLLNAVVESGIDAATYGRLFDSCWLDFSKGLGAPIGAALAGSAEFIRQAWRWKQMWGGAMRQSGIIAAAALHALDHHVDRLAEDNARARQLGAALGQIPAISWSSQVETNIVFFDLAQDAPVDAPQLAERLMAEGIQIGAFGPRRIRVVTHLDVDDGAVDALLAALRRHLAG